MRLILSVYLLTVFVLSVAAHAATFIPSLSITMSQVGFLHIAVLLSGILLAAYGQRTRPRGQSNEKRGIFTLSPASEPVFKGICGFFLIYAIYNFVLLPSGTPTIQNGHYELQTHGRTIRTIGEEEYNHINALVVRTFSSFWMLFSAAFTLLCFFGSPTVSGKKS